MTISKTRQAEIRRFYRSLRVAVDKTQYEVAAAARMDQHRYFRIEQARTFPTPEERKLLARVLKVAIDALPMAAVVAHEASA